MENLCVDELRQSPNRAHADAVQKLYERIGALRTSMTPSDQGVTDLMPRPMREQVNIPYVPPKQTGPRLGGFIPFPWHRGRP